MKRRGVNYDVGLEYSKDHTSRRTFDSKVVQRELEIIKNDLRCNAVRISGTNIEHLIAASKIGLELGLEVWLSPHLYDQSPEITLDYIVRCAKAAEALRQNSTKLVFILGSELTLFMQGILGGKTLMRRIMNPVNIFKLKILGTHNKPLNIFLAKATQAVREVFKGQIAYAAAPIEKVNWTLFDFVSLDYYRGKKNRAVYGEKLEPYMTLGKPVVLTEVGLCTYRGAENAGGRGWAITDKKHPERLKKEYVRDESLQAHELIDMLRIADKAGVDGAFAFTFIAPELPYNANLMLDLDMASYSLVKSYSHDHGTTYTDMSWEPKESFMALADFYNKNS